MEEGMIKIGFTFTDEFGNQFSHTSTVGSGFDVEANDIDIIGIQLNTFLQQCGFPRKNRYIFMEDVTAKEHDELLDYLNKLRTETECDGE